MCELKKSTKIKVDRAKLYEPSEIQSSNFILDKCTLLSQCGAMKLNWNRQDKQWWKLSFSFRGCAGMAELAETPDVAVYTLIKISIWYSYAVSPGNASWVSNINLGRSYWMLMFCLRKISRVCSEQYWKPEIQNCSKGNLWKKNTNKHEVVWFKFNLLIWLIFIFQCFHFALSFITTFLHYNPCYSRI